MKHRIYLEAWLPWHGIHRPMGAVYEHPQVIQQTLANKKLMVVRVEQLSNDGQQIWQVMPVRLARRMGR